ncbi:M23 family metallopeptidase [Candidatus Daviesbacteria bacterium]|nr:M23 family metallopeptidase [Candidatus Daviesbacteria bacterium]
MRTNTYNPSGRDTSLLVEWLIWQASHQAVAFYLSTTAVVAWSQNKLAGQSRLNRDQWQKTLEASPLLRLARQSTSLLTVVKKMTISHLVARRSPIKTSLHLAVVGVVFLTSFAPTLELPFLTPKISQAKTVLAATVAPAFRPPLASSYLSQDFFAYHPGNDLAAPLGSPVFPIAPGKVTFAGFRFDGHGNTIEVDHGDGLVSLYAHLGEIKVAKNQEVDKLTVIGTVGLTGFTSGPHLHVEVTDNGRAINPKTLLQ